MVTTFYPPAHFGGDAVSVQILARALVEDGHHVEVVHCLDSHRLLAQGPAPSSFPDDPAGPVVHRLRSPLGWLAPLLTQQLGHPLLQRHNLRRLLAGHFDVVHYHNVSLVGGPAVLRYGSGLKLYSTHEFWLVCPMHILHKHNRRPCERPACLRCSLAFRRPPQWWRYTGLLQRAARAVDVFIAPSQFCIDKHREMGFAAAPFVRLPNFVPEAALLDDVPPPAPTPTRPYFLFVGRLERIKGLQTLIPLFRDYARAELSIAGRGREQRALERLAGASPNIRFLGYRERPALAGLYHHAVAAVVPSLCYEVFPTVILEAFQQGTPVIARDLGGMRELVEESQGGCLFHDDDGFARARELLLDDPAARTQLGRHGQETAATTYSKAAYLARYYAIIDEHLARRPAPG